MSSELEHHSSSYLCEDTGPVLVAISGLFICLDTIFLAVRFYSGRLQKSPVGLDDFVISLAWLINIGLCILAILMVYDAGVGRHLAYHLQNDPGITVAWAKLAFALELLYLPSCTLPKISVLLLYLRIFTSRSARMVSHALIWVLIASWVAFSIACVLQCTPFAYQWDKEIPRGKCIDIPLLYKFQSTANIATDIAIFVLPLNTIVRLHASVGRKLGVLFIFSVGSVGIVASIIRTAAFFQTDAFEDRTWTSVKLVSWSIVEPGMYIIAACSLKLRPVMRKAAETFHLRKLFDSVSEHMVDGSDGRRDAKVGHMRSPLGFYKMPRVQQEDNELVGLNVE